LLCGSYPAIVEGYHRARWGVEAVEALKAKTAVIPLHFGIDEELPVRVAAGVLGGGHPWASNKRRFGYKARHGAK